MVGRFRFQFNGKPRVISLGTYPEVSLADARDKRDVARKQVAAGVDPGKHRKAQKEEVVKAALTFETVAREWHGKQE